MQTCRSTKVSTTAAAARAFELSLPRVLDILGHSHIPQPMRPKCFHAVIEERIRPYTIMQSIKASNVITAPSSRWTSYDGWDYGGMKERLEKFILAIDTRAFTLHAEKLLDKQFTISKPFSAGQYWVCFELVADDGDLVIARARLPRHPNETSKITIDDESYAMGCESATMRYLNSLTLSIPSPRLYAYAAPGSDLAVQAGCAYMLIQGFYGNTLEDVQFDICQLPITQQERIMSQWTAYQAELATLTFPQIGSICSISDTGEPVLGRLSSAAFEGLASSGPFADARSYFLVIAQARLHTEDESNGTSIGDEATDDQRWSRLGAKAFLDIVQNTSLYSGEGSMGPFHFNHMDLGTQNILVDDDFNFIAIIDWEFAQSAPWEINHYPMPFPLISPPEEEGAILADPRHIAYHNVSRQVTARGLYREGFRTAEEFLRFDGRKLLVSIADTIESPAARIFGCFEKLGVFPGQAESLTHEMIRLAFGYSDRELEGYLNTLSSVLETTFG